MTIRYDLSELAPAARVGITRHLDELGMMYNLREHILSVSDKDEVTVDAVISRFERMEEALEQLQSDARQVFAGASTFPCEVCGSRPAAPLELRRQVGLVVVLQTYTAESILCSFCAELAYKDFQKQTAVKGWTGVRSALMNPVILVSNANNIKKHREEISRLKSEGRT
jgi:hypothetical protein